MTISHGTLRLQDLIPTFLAELRARAPAHYAQLMLLPPAHAQEDDDAEWWHSDASHELLNELFDLLDEHAPEGHYFGAHPGDASDFGYWPLDED